MDRLFVALDVPKHIKSKFSEILYKLDSLKAKTVPLENIHLTLKFIGETNKLKEICDSLEEVKFRKFTVSVSTVGIFGSVFSPKVFWVGVEKNENLKLLAEEVEKSLLRVGIPKDNRPFSPHITLARFKVKPDPEKLEVILKEYNINFGVFEVEGFVLYRSELLQPNPRYQPLKLFPLT